MIKGLILPILSLFVSPFVLSSRASISRSIKGTKDFSYSSHVSVEYISQGESETFYHFRVKNKGEKILTDLTLSYTDDNYPVEMTTYLSGIHLPPQKTYDYYEVYEDGVIKPGVLSCWIESATAVSGTVYDSKSVQVDNLLYGNLQEDFVFSSTLTNVLFYFDATNTTSFNLSLGFFELYQDGNLFTTMNSEFLSPSVSSYSTKNMQITTSIPQNLLSYFDSTLTMQAYFYQIDETNDQVDYSFQIAYIILGAVCVLFTIGLIAVVIIFCYRKEKKK